MSANTALTIREFDAQRDRSSVVELWRTVFGYSAPHNEPGFVIDRKLEANDGLFFVAEREGAIIGTVMAGYDGHRGWIYSLAVNSKERRKGIGRRLLQHAEQALSRRGCVKVNLQVMEGNKAVVGFYEKVGYSIEPRVSMGKLLSESR